MFTNARVTRRSVVVPPPGEIPRSKGRGSRRTSSSMLRSMSASRPSVFLKSPPVPEGIDGERRAGKRLAPRVEVGLADFVERAVPAHDRDEVQRPAPKHSWAIRVASPGPSVGHSSTSMPRPCRARWTVGATRPAEPLPAVGLTMSAARKAGRGLHASGVTEADFALGAATDLNAARRGVSVFRH